MAGASSDAIDLAELQAFLDRLHDAERDGALLAEVVDLLTGGYMPFSQTYLPRLLDSLTNEIRSRDEIVGPGLRGRPLWDRTLVSRLNRRLAPGSFVSRMPHRSFELPENRALRWLLDDIRTQIEHATRIVGTNGLHADLATLLKTCEVAHEHNRLGDVVSPTSLTDEMLTAAERHRHQGYRMVGKLARRRRGLRDRRDRLHNMLQLLAVNWLRPISDDDLFELFGLVLCLDVIAEELAFGPAEEFGLVMRDRSYVALFRKANHVVKVYFDQSPSSILGGVSRYASVVADHDGISPSAHRPDILIVVETDRGRTVALVDMKNTTEQSYIRDSIYKMMGYLHDFQEVANGCRPVQGLLIFPKGVKPRKSGLQLSMVSGSDRGALATVIQSLL